MFAFFVRKSWFFLQHSHCITDALNHIVVQLQVVVDKDALPEKVVTALLAVGTVTKLYIELSGIEAASRRGLGHPAITAKNSLNLLEEHTRICDDNNQLALASHSKVVTVMILTDTYPVIHWVRILLQRDEMPSVGA
ncbi:hypothetical protein PC116_g20477 [Phytophthora cactorum]|uniref:Uncharacterized protein n=1 Tax=Phytophthora cactorum TaxID=29920 RepID=A0A8T1BBU7_9STRA|nr:hypothetical protein Pcac1_g20925 [Phytophthora cactorum]KAG2899488.1 hypothetical protein PC117_g22201 [Phytophthora cactorum]KAG4231241.1 hypothetical protein PC116_g20477 [Phytophthora cactorum]